MNFDVCLAQVSHGSGAAWATGREIWGRPMGPGGPGAPPGVQGGLRHIRSFPAAYPPLKPRNLET